MHKSKQSFRCPAIDNDIAFFDPGFGYIVEMPALWAENFANNTRQIPLRKIFRKVKDL